MNELAKFLSDCQITNEMFPRKENPRKYSVANKAKKRKRKLAQKSKRRNR